MAQLVERRVRNAKVRGSNPLISTTKISYKCTIFFLCGKGDSHDFIVVLLCNMNPFGLTLTLLRKRPGRFLRIPLSPPQKYRTNVRYFFMWDRGFPRFHRGVALQHEPLRADNKRRVTQARSICGHRVQSHSQQIRHGVSAKGAVQRTIC